MILYKYYSVNINTLKSIALNSFWCCSASKMNDPFECLTGSEYRLSEDEFLLLRRLLKEKNDSKTLQFSQLTNENIELFFNKSRAAFIDKYAFCSFSTNPDNILLWSHYADGHKGFVIGFEFKEIAKNHSFQEIKYLNHLPPINLEEWVDYQFGGKDEGMSQEMGRLSYKTDCWVYEDEWRFWIENEGYYDFTNLGEIREVHFGVKMDNYSRNLVLKTLNLPESFDYKVRKISTSPLKIIA